MNTSLCTTKVHFLLSRAHDVRKYCDSEENLSPSQGRRLTQTQNKHRHQCLDWEPTTPVFKRTLIFHALDCVANVIAPHSKTQWILANPVTANPDVGNPDRSIKNESFRSQLISCFKRHVAFRKADESLVQTKPDSLFKLALLRPKTSTTPEFYYRWINIVFL
jgi:hypothetical protein